MAAAQAKQGRSALTRIDKASKKRDAEARMAKHRKQDKASKKETDKHFKMNNGKAKMRKHKQSHRTVRARCGRPARARSKRTARNRKNAANIEQLDVHSKTEVIAGCGRSARACRKIAKVKKMQAVLPTGSKSRATRTQQE